MLALCTLGVQAALGEGVGVGVPLPVACAWRCACPWWSGWA